jgi:hypothetical protein
MDSPQQGSEMPGLLGEAESSALLDAHFSSSQNLFRSASRSCSNPVKRYFSLCGNTIELSFADERLLPFITPALEHLACAATGNLALKIHIWDDVLTGTEMTLPPWFGYAVRDSSGNVNGLVTSRGDVRGFSSSRIKTAFNWSANALSMYDSSAATALYWTRDARELPAYETSAPLRNILNWWAEERSLHFAHGAAVGTPHGGVLMAGKGGSGKSTAALSCLGSGLLYVSDDYCLVTAEPEPAVYSVFNSAKVDPDNISRVHKAMPARANTLNRDEEKMLFFLYPGFAGQISAGFPLRAILLPRITGRANSSLSPASHMDGLKSLVISTMCQFPGAGKTALDILQGIVGKLPCYYLDFGTETEQVPELIMELLEKSEGI